MKRLKYFALAALVAFAACDEGNEGVVPDPTTGTISGTVTVDGTGLAGVTVTLSSGATATTAANGDYAFSDVEAGAYTVTISGMPSDAAFGTTSKAAVITTAGQVVDVDFSGSFITTSAISATVSVPGVGGLSGATVAISGPSTASQVTPASGTVTFSGLRAGDYTVTATLSSGDAALYDLDDPSVDVDLAVDELEAVAFTATPKTISTITGRLYIDEQTKNNSFDAGNEDNLTIADVDVVIEGVSVGVFDTIQTDANGEYSLVGLPAANYRITLDETPFTGAVELGTQNDIVITLGVADTEVVNFGFDIVTQRVVVGAFLGCDADATDPACTDQAAGVRAMPGVDIDVYATETDASIPTGSIGDGTTGSDGFTTITFPRADDRNPLNSDPDNIVFAARTAEPGFTANGEDILEIAYSAKDSLVTYDDVFDFLNSEVTIAFNVQEIDGDVYEGVPVRMVDDPMLAAIGGGQTDADGTVYLSLTTTGTFGVQTQPATGAADWDAAFTAAGGATGDLPNVGTMAVRGPATFTETFDEAAGEADAGYIFFENDGTNLPTDTVFIGTGNLAWNQVDVYGRAYRENNDEMFFQPGDDDFSNVDVIQYQMQFDSLGTWTDYGVVGAAGVNGGMLRAQVPTGRTYRYIANTQNALSPELWAVLNDTIVDFAVDGSDQVTYPCPLREAGTTTFATCGTFAYKNQDGTLTGSVLYRDGSDVPDGTQVRVTVDEATIQGRFLDADSDPATEAVFETTAGQFTVTGVREGFYTVTPISDEPAVLFTETTNGDAEDAEVRGNGPVVVVDEDAGFQAVTPATFHAHRTDASIRGYVVNDRDEDGNTVDNNEALVGAIVTLYANDGAADDDVATDSIIGTAEIGADGLFEFTDLVTRRYNLEAVAPGAEIVLSDGAVDDTQYSVVPDNLDIDINPAPTAALPFWNFATSAIENTGEAGEQSSYFTFLFSDGTYSGVVLNGEDDSGVENMSLQLVLCEDFDEGEDGLPDIPLVPTPGTCTDGEGAVVPGSFENVLTAADGSYSFDSLREGVYQITIQTASAGDSDGAFDPASTTGNGMVGEQFVFFIDGATDLEQIEFVVNN